MYISIFYLHLFSKNLYMIQILVVYVCGDFRPPVFNPLKPFENTLFLALFWSQTPHFSPFFDSKSRPTTS